MPAYFMPANIPPLEAFKQDYTVLCSLLTDLRDHVKDTALLLDLKIL